MNGKMAGTKPLYVALAQRKEDRRMRLQAQFAQRAVASGGMPGMPYGMPPPGVPPGAAMYYGQPPPGVMGPPQPQPGFGFQPIMPPGPGRPMGPGGPMQYANMPMPQRGGMPGQRGRGGRGGRGGVQGGRGQQMRGFNQNMPPAPPAPNMPNMPPAPETPMSAVEQLAAQLPNASQDQQRMLLGEALYPLVDAVEPASSAKITGMLLEMDQSEVLHLIEDSKALSDKVQEAVSVLKAAAAEEGN